MPGAGGRVTSNSIGEGEDSMSNRLDCGFAQQEAMSLDQPSVPLMVEQESYEHAAWVVAWTVDGPAGEGFRIVMRELLFDGVETRVELVVGIVLRVVQHP